MKNPFEGLLELQHVRVITKRAQRLGFCGQDMDEVVQLTAIRLARTDIREEAMLCSATLESAADVCRREARHRGRVDRLQQLAIQETVDSTDAASGLEIDLDAFLTQLPECDRKICELLKRGRSMGEIAMELGISKSGVRNKMLRIRRQLAEAGFDEVA